jgi:heat-inducible transcriptional repressor
MNASRHDLDARARQLLRALIARYIAEGQPVGSRTLAKASGLDVSPATIRNIMSDLEDFGLVAAPHTSAGRVPTSQGYRVFVDSLLEVKPLDESSVDKLRRELPTDAPAPDLLSSATSLLSEMTHFVGVVSTPRREEFPFRHIDFVPLDAGRLLVILVFTDGQVQNRVVQLDRRFSPDELRRAAAYLNELFAGQELEGVRSRLVAQLQETREQMNRLMVDAITIAQHAFAEEPRSRDADMVVAGETNLMGFAELSNVDRLRKLFEAFNEKRDILHLLDQSLHAEGVQIFIGHESGYRILDACSVVVAPYTQDDRVVGVLGVIGPTRMAYERVIPVVDIAARMLGSALNSRD